MQHLVIQQIVAPNDAVDVNKRLFRHNSFLLKGNLVGCQKLDVVSVVEMNQYKIYFLALFAFSINLL